MSNAVSELARLLNVPESAIHVTERALRSKDRHPIPEGTPLMRREQALEALRCVRPHCANLTIGQWGTHGTTHLDGKRMTLVSERLVDDRRPGPQTWCDAREVQRIKESLQAENNLRFPTGGVERLTALAAEREGILDQKTISRLVNRGLLEPESKPNRHGGPHSMRRVFTREALLAAKQTAEQFDAPHNGIYGEEGRLDLKVAAELLAVTYSTLWNLVRHADKATKQILDPQKKALGCGGKEWTLLRSGVIELWRFRSTRIMQGELGPQWKTPTEIAECMGCKSPGRRRALGGMLTAWRTDENTRLVWKEQAGTNKGRKYKSLRKVFLYDFPKFNAHIAGRDVQRLDAERRRMLRTGSIHPEEATVVSGQSTPSPNNRQGSERIEGQLRIQQEQLAILAEKLDAIQQSIGERQPGSSAPESIVGQETPVSPQPKANQPEQGKSRRGRPPLHSTRRVYEFCYVGYVNGVPFETIFKRAKVKFQEDAPGTLPEISRNARRYAERNELPLARETSQ